jgi:hypothetical protein
VGQVAPVGIIFFDQPRLPVTVPVLQLLLARDCFLGRSEGLRINEAMHPVFSGEFRAATAAMLLKPIPQVVGDADIEGSVAAARENVDVLCAC